MKIPTTTNTNGEFTNFKFRHSDKQTLPPYESKKKQKEKEPTELLAVLLERTTYAGTKGRRIVAVYIFGFSFGGW